MTSFAAAFLDEAISAIRQMSPTDIDDVAAVLATTKERGGRLFFAGSGGGAGHASHAAADFRKLGGFEAYSVSDNTSELTARVNDDGWDTAYSRWLEGSRIGEKDCLFVFSVGGGDKARGVSNNLVNAMQLAKERGSSVVGVAGRDGGELARCADACVVVPTISENLVTPLTEGFQAVVWHLLVSHPLLDPCTPKWESIAP